MFLFDRLLRSAAMHLAWCACALFLIQNAAGTRYVNETLNPALDPATQQLLEFKLQHPRPIGVWTTSAGKPVEVRESVTLNTDVFNNANFYDMQSSVDQERIPERIVHTKGAGAFGYFEVTHDVSKYTKAELFNGIGKITPVAARFSYQLQNFGGLDLVREQVAMSTKFYTKEGNLDFLSLNLPIYLYRDPAAFNHVAHAFKRNPKTNLFDITSRVDNFNLAPDILHLALWLFSDFGITNGYRKMDVFPIHAYEVTNKHGDSHFVRFNFRTEQGVELLTSAAAQALRGADPDYSSRDLYNAIATGNFPSWRLDMDVIPKHDLKKLKYNPSDVTRLWENGTYHTVTIGRLVINRNPDNFFKDVEQAAYNPGNLVPGIPGPRDIMFRARRMAYRDTQSYRLGKNHNNIEVNRPKYAKVYTRDGVPPVNDNMKDAPNYYPNSFNGPVPFVDTAAPQESLLILDRASVDLQPSADFYRNFVKTEGQKNRLAENIGTILAMVPESLQKSTLQLLDWIDQDLGRRVALALAAAPAAAAARRPVLTVVEAYPRTLDLVRPTG